MTDILYFFSNNRYISSKLIPTSLNFDRIIVNAIIRTCNFYMLMHLLYVKRTMLTYFFFLGTVLPDEKRTLTFWIRSKNVSEIFGNFSAFLNFIPRNINTKQSYFTCSVWLGLIDDAWMADSGIENAITGHKITNVAAILLRTFCIPLFQFNPETKHKKSGINK